MAESGKNTSEYKLAAGSALAVVAGVVQSITTDDSLSRDQVVLRLGGMLALAIVSAVYTWARTARKNSGS